MNARFWIIVHGSPVKITLIPGQSLEHGYSGRTEEGYHSEWQKWEHDIARVLHDSYTDARDCDGRYSTSCETYCNLDELQDGYHNPERGVTYPSWSLISRGQRDFTAEAAGY